MSNAIHLPFLDEPNHPRFAKYLNQMGFVSYGGVSAGTRAVQMPRQLDELVRYADTLRPLREG